MNFANPLWFAAFALLPVLAYFYMIAKKRKKRLSLRFSSINLLKEAAGDKKLTDRDKILFAINLAVLALLITALADPHIPLRQTKKGANIVLAIDVSGSMQATDYKPSRIEAAKAAAENLLKELNPGDLAGIVVFSNGATTSSYLTPLKDKVITKLRSIKATDGATAIGDGLSLAIDMATSIPSKKKVVILLSDGVNNAGVVSPDKAIEFAKSNGMQVYTIGMGSEKPVLLGYDFFGRPQYAKLDEATLKKIAESTGGQYFRSVNATTLSDIYAKLPEKIERELEDTSIKDWFIAAALVVFSFWLYLKYWRFRSLP
ncbi:MAG: VWA domain-containing protein [Candidatus Aenigmarchaeota archaeon]|nr:VWA domain-containing protein [Candidatus Aenigmarchaeota archaeon]